MTGKVVLDYSHPSFFLKTRQFNSSDSLSVGIPENFYSPYEIATAVTFCVAIFQVKFPQISQQL